MMNQLTVSYEEIENRLAICCEFLLDRKRSSEEAYESLMEKLGTKLMKYTEFEYWFKRFQNDQFDLGYDTSQDPNEVQEASGKKDASTMTIEREESVKVVKRNTEELKLNYQFKEENVPQDFQTFVYNLSKKLGIKVLFTERGCKSYIDTNEIDWEKRGNDWMISYADNDTVIKTDDPEKSITDHLWFMLRNPNIKLSFLEFFDKTNQNYKPPKMDSEKMNKLVQSMFNTFDHQIQTTTARCDGFNEDTCLSMLKHVKPGTLEEINLKISWKKVWNYQKMKEIVETDQWKRAKTIDLRGVTPLKIADLLQFERFSLQLDRITPEDVLRVTEHYFNSIGRKHCTLSPRKESLDIDTIKDVLRLQNDGSEITEIYSHLNHFQFKIVKSTKRIDLNGCKNYITIRNC